MEITIRSQDDMTIVEISGNLDSNTSAQAESQITPLIKPNSCLILDMKQCNYVSSAGLRVLLMIAKMLAREGGKAILSGLSEEVADVMEMTGFGAMFPKYPTTVEAIEAIRKERS